MTIQASDLKARLPDVTSSLTAELLDDEVTIIRDSFGVPHIKATTAHDAFFAQGFVTAQDRLFHMDYDRMRALGRWSEWVGESALSQDILMRKLGIARAAKADLNVSAPAAQAMVRAHTAGINFYLSTLSEATLPVEYALAERGMPDCWEDYHTFALYKMRNLLMGHLDMKVWRARVVMELGPEAAAKLFLGYPQGALVTTPPNATSGLTAPPLHALATVYEELNRLHEIDCGSNSWVVGGDRTTSGLPLLAGDSHRGLDTPSVYYQIHMACNDFSVSGYAVPGVPGAPHFSHTAHVGFGMTHGYADYQDAFIEHLREQPDGRLEYSFDGGWYPADVRTESISVKGVEEPVEVEVVVTRHGPVVEGNPREDPTGRERIELSPARPIAGIGVAGSSGAAPSKTRVALAACLTGIDERGTKWMDAVLDMLLAKSADDIEAAVNEWTEPVNNYMYCDTAGEFGYRLRGRVPIRRDADRNNAGTWVPVPGFIADHEWERLIPPNELPSVRNPENGYAVTCNQKVTTDDYPYIISQHYGSDARARRITERIEQVAPGAMTVAEMGSIHKERVSITGQYVIKVVSTIDPAGLSNEALALHKLLLGWDGDMQPELHAPTAFAAVAEAVTKKTVPAIFGQNLGDAILGGGRGGPTHWATLKTALFKEAAEEPAGDGHMASYVLGEGDSWAALFAEALEVGGKALAERLGAFADNRDAWLWGKVHTTAPTHPLSQYYPDAAELLDPPAVPMGGGFDTPQAASFGGWGRHGYTVSGLSVNRYIHDPSDWSNSRWVVPLGASGHPGSPHYSDQALIYSAVDTIPQLWTWEDVIADAETTQVLAAPARAKM